jgi:hypothetical protein
MSDESKFHGCCVGDGRVGGLRRKCVPLSDENVLIGTNAVLVCDNFNNCVAVGVPVKPQFKAELLIGPEPFNIARRAS